VSGLAVRRSGFPFRDRSLRIADEFLDEQCYPSLGVYIVVVPSSYTQYRESVLGLEEFSLLRGGLTL
jgi:hypothetical protein